MLSDEVLDLLEAITEHYILSYIRDYGDELVPEEERWESLPSRLASALATLANISAIRANKRNSVTVTEMNYVINKKAGNESQ